MSSFSAMIRDFHDKFDPSLGSGKDFLDKRMAMLAEEVRETAEASDDLAATPESLEAKAALVKELTDVLFVACGTLHQLGVSSDEAFAEVFNSNMSKTPSPEKFGKAIKGPAYKPADMMKLMGVRDAG